MKNTKTSIKDAINRVRKETGNKITNVEIYSYIRIGELKADQISRRFIVDIESLNELIAKMKTVKVK